MTRKCSYCRSSEHSACTCTSPLLLNCLSELCQQYNYILNSISGFSTIRDEVITSTDHEFKQFLHQRQRYYNNTLNVLVRNLRLTVRMTPYATSCLLISQYIFARSQRGYTNLPILYGIPIMAQEFFMINRIYGGFESPELAHYKDFILNNDILKIILNLKFKPYVSLQTEYVYMIETEGLEDCPICMNQILTTSKVTTNCNHNYCNSCFDQLVTHAKLRNVNELPKCALCRVQISKCYKHTVNF